MHAICQSAALQNPRAAYALQTPRAAYALQNPMQKRCRTCHSATTSTFVRPVDYGPVISASTVQLSSPDAETHTCRCFSLQNPSAADALQNPMQNTKHTSAVVATCKTPVQLMPFMTAKPYLTHSVQCSALKPARHPGSILITTTKKQSIC